MYMQNRDDNTYDVCVYVYIYIYTHTCMIIIMLSIVVLMIIITITACAGGLKPFPLGAIENFNWARPT